MFSEAITAYGQNVSGVRGTWLGGGELADNFNAFKNALKTAPSGEAAAMETFTGKMAKKYGYSKARVVQDDEVKVVVEFTRE